MTESIQFSEHLIQDGFAYSYALSAADLTGNGKLDLVVPDTNVGLYWYENDGKGNFTEHLIQRRTGQWLERHAIADIDGDGKPEIVLVDNINGCLLYFFMKGTRETVPRGNIDILLRVDCRVLMISRSLILVATAVSMS